MKACYNVFLILLSITGFSNVYAETNWSVKFADAIIARWPNSINDMTNKQWEYSNSIVLHSIEKVYEETGDVKYLNYIKEFADDFIDSNGNITYKTSAHNLDLIHPSLLCIFLYEETGLEKYKIAAQNTRLKFNTHPRNPSKGYWHKDNYPNQMWLDGIYMAEPFLIKYGNMFADSAYCSDESTFQITLLNEHAYDATDKLLYHGWDETKSVSWAQNTADGVSPEIWSRAMGWYAMALVDVLKYLPETHKRYSELITILNNIAEGLKNTQDATTGLWYQVVDKGNLSSNWIETSGSGMFIYSLKHAIDRGYIDASYLTVVDKAWEGLQNYISLDGFNRPVISDYVGGMGILNSYNSYVGKNTETCPPSLHPHGYCGVMMAATAMENTYRPMFETKVTVTGNGSFEFEKGGFYTDSGKVVTIKAIPDEGNKFENWSGDASGTNETISFTIKENATLNLNFTIGEGPIKIANIFEAEDATWSDNSVVESEHSGFSGTGYVNTPNDLGEYITFSVTVDETKEYSFNLTYANGSSADRQFDVVVNDVNVLTNQSCSTVGWTTYADASFNLTLNEGVNNIKIVATTVGGLANIDKLYYQVNHYILNVIVAGDGAVDFSNQESYKEGTEVTLTAIESEGSVFTGWSGDVTSTEEEIVITMDQHYNVTANFDIIQSVEQVNAQTFQVYPNPADDILIIDINDAIQLIEIYNLEGSEVRVFDGIDSNSIDLSSLNNGIYCIKVITENNSFTERIVKK